MPALKRLLVFLTWSLSACAVDPQPLSLQVDTVTLAYAGVREYLARHPPGDNIKTICIGDYHQAVAVRPTPRLILEVLAKLDPRIVGDPSKCGNMTNEYRASDSLLVVYANPLVYVGRVSESGHIPSALAASADFRASSGII